MFIDFLVIHLFIFDEIIHMSAYITKERSLVDVELNQAFFFSPSTPIIKNISSKAGNPEHNPKIHQ